MPSGLRQEACLEQALAGLLLGVPLVQPELGRPLGLGLVQLGHLQDSGRRPVQQELGPPQGLVVSVLVLQGAHRELQPLPLSQEVSVLEEQGVHQQLRQQPLNQEVSVLREQGVHQRQPLNQEVSVLREQGVHQPLPLLRLSLQVSTLEPLRKNRQPVQLLVLVGLPLADLNKPRLLKHQHQEEEDLAAVSRLGPLPAQVVAV